MKLLAMHIAGHDANVTYYDGEKVQYCKIERIVQKKHYAYTQTTSDYYNWIQVKQDLHFLNIDWNNLDTVCFSYAGRRSADWVDKSQPFRTDDTLVAEVTPEQFDYCFPNLNITAKKYIRVDHHYAHHLSARFLYGDEYTSGVVIDGAGDYWNHISVFKDDKKIIKYDFQNMFSIGELYTNWGNRSLGKEYADVDELAQISQDTAGNVMGLMSYGKFNVPFAKKVANLHLEECVEALLNEHAFARQFMNSHHHYHEKTWQSAKPAVAAWWYVDYMHTCQEILREKIRDFFARHFTSQDKITFSGGVAHNVLINQTLNDHFVNLAIPPCVGDEGLSLGAMKYLSTLYNLDLSFPTGQAAQITPSVIPDKHISIIAQELCNGKIVATCSGEGEIGPRALGNRSLLYRTDMLNAPKYFNSRGLKRREWWRPYGISILEEDMESYLNTTTLSPYMLHVANPTSLGKDVLSGVLHVDNTVRYQTVNESNGWYYKLLVELKNLTGHGVVVNTSLNCQGAPLINTPIEALSFHHQYKPDASFIGDEMYVS